MTGGFTTGDLGAGWGGADDPRRESNQRLDIDLALSKAAQLLLDPHTPVVERARLARDMRHLFREYESWATERQQARALDAARRLRKDVDS